MTISGENENETAYTYLNDPDNMKFPDDSIDVTSDVKDMPKIMAESGHSHPNQVQYISLLDNAPNYLSMNFLYVSYLLTKKMSERHVHFSSLLL